MRHVASAIQRIGNADIVGDGRHDIGAAASVHESNAMKPIGTHAPAKLSEAFQENSQAGREPYASRVNDAQLGATARRLGPCEFFRIEAVCDQRSRAMK
jgi:hypothetical protein